jgi:hypothetical protein
MCSSACYAGYSGQNLLIAEQYPELIKSLMTGEDQYTPSTLSSIAHKAQGGASKSKPSALLPIDIEYWMPFLTKEGHKTTLQIALRENFSVNTIIGMPMIFTAKLSVHLLRKMLSSQVYWILSLF